MKSNKYFSKKQNGFSLLELLVVMIFFTVLLTLVSKYRAENKISIQGNEIKAFVESVTPKVLALHPTEIATIDTAAVIALDYATQYEVDTLGVKSIVLPGTTSVTFSPNGTNTATDMAINGVSSISCVDLVKKLWTQGSTMSVNGNPVKSNASQTVSSQAATIDTECNNSANVVLVPLTNFT